MGLPGFTTATRPDEGPAGPPGARRQCRGRRRRGGTPGSAPQRLDWQARIVTARCHAASGNAGHEGEGM